MKKNTQRAAMLALAFSFLLGVKNGHLAVWVHDDPQPAHIFPIKVSSLPPADQILLRGGIRAETKTQLMGVIEDYLP